MRDGYAITAAAAIGLSAAALTLSAGTARAQPIQGPYISLGAGLHVPNTPKATPYGPGWGTGRVEMNQNFGFNANLALGYGIGNGFRFEIEGDFLRSTLRSVGGTPFPTAGSGTVRTWGAMANMLYDLDIGSPWVFPYLGVGAGYQWTKLNTLSAIQPGGPFAFGTDGQAGTFAWQAIAGASFPIPNMPGLSITADYRFMDILGGEKFYGPLQASANGPVTTGALKMHNQYNNEVVIGVRYALFVPPPPVPATPPAPPAPTAARTFMVFFDWDKATLTDRARQIVKEAAQSSTQVQYTRIEVNGYTDTSGTPQYNKGLSIRRAEAVASELVRNGVPKTAIAIQGFGETHLLVPTGPNVREPQNRRVEIIINS
ncbi:OmpA family protein [Rhodopila sp.]|jgi:outer membrane protein OmpA-like peptidoglycan-associated protein|uniref:OmpA family protein n=1 Tax=Rhodopila sp. TaxID=2480087 RepID=UPI002C042E47|nr:OmpA family protein [Rhodopila sp.]HVZ08330.1 OmpA family protein [Rhodopila sp.]